MNKKGFTLVELLAVIGIIGLIAIILIPNITKSSMRVKNNLYDTKIKSIVKASHMCEEDKKDDCDMISVLLNAKYLSSDSGSSCTENCLKNPIDGTYLDNCFVVGNKVSCTTRAEKLINKVKSLAGSESDDSLNIITSSSPSGSTCTNTLAYDGTTDKNLRYVGANPCNYVTFNGETAGWRIIGVMNNIEDFSSEKKSLVKLIRTTRLGTYSWDTTDSSINSGNGLNNWETSKIKTELNGDYLNTKLTTNQYWYNGINNQKTYIYNPKNGLTSNAQKLISEVKWPLGGINYSTFLAQDYYTEERGTNEFNGNPTSWIGKIALAYPSDYLYAVGGNNRVNCLSSNFSAPYCYGNDWMKETKWLLPTTLGSNQIAYILYEGDDGVNRANVNSAGPIYPTFFLNSNTIVVSGNGSKENPYVLE